MNTGTMPGDRERTLEELSAFADGELEEPRVLRACQQWRADGDWRATWHAYHLIGDVLRSDDLASDPARDEDFVARLRSRLAGEAVPLAPSRVEAADASTLAATPAAATASMPAVARSQRGWRASSAVAVAAGFVVVAGVLLVTRVPDSPAPSLAGGATVPASRMAAADPAPARTALPAAVGTSVAATVPMAGPAAVGSETTVAAAGPPASVASGKLIRDVRLDRYLSAHKEFAGSSALGVPSGFLRNATADASDR